MATNGQVIGHGVGTEKDDIKEWSQQYPTTEREFDEEKHHGETRQLPDLQRRLKSRHLQMIAMGKSSGCVSSP